MTTRVLTLAGVLLLILACDREPASIPAIQFIGSTGCKGHFLKTEPDSANLDCIQYAWLKGDTLVIKHVNAGFNCCPGGFGTTLRVSGDTLIVEEREDAAMCDCDCLFDLDYYLSGVARRTWWLRIVEPYVDTLKEEALFSRIELRKEASGEFCVTRDYYPWGY
jgi:hypothetical protein